MPSTGSGTESSSKYNTVPSTSSGIGSVTEGGNIIPVIELVEITGIMSENVPSTSSDINFR